MRSNFLSGFSLCLFLCHTLITSPARAEIKLPAIYSDNAVLQQGLPVKVWGWAAPEEAITVELAGKSAATKAGPQGNWQVTLPAGKADGKSYTLKVSGTETVTRSNLVFGEVWVCSGQSNMGWTVTKSRDGDLEALAISDPNLRLITIGNQGSQTPVKDFNGSWTIASGESVSKFSAVGYYYGRELRRILNVPVGLINNAWGGSACEAWVPRDVLESDKRNHPYLENFKAAVAKFEDGSAMAKFEKQKASWKERVKKAKAAGNPAPRAPRKPRDPRYGQHRPANLYQARIVPILGYGIKGAIWYQGENNTNGRSYNYRYLLPMMIETWRKNWGVGDFSFYWASLADFAAARDADGFSPWAEIRESMTVAMHATPNTGQAIITDLGEDKDIHPRNKVDVAKRLVRWALVKDYKLPLKDYRSPEYKSHVIKDGKVTIDFNHLNGNLRTFDIQEVKGFTIAGEDKIFKPAKAIIKGQKITVWHDEIKTPASVRYAWAGNPVCNVYTITDLPLTPFRTDDWKLGSQ